MAHDYIDFGGRYVRLSDWDIWTLRQFFLQVAKESVPSDFGTDQATAQSLIHFLENWKWLGPGIITGTNLSDFVEDDPERVNVLLSLFERTIGYLQGLGDVIPLEYLERHVNSPDAYYTVEQPTSRFIKAVETIRAMVRESIQIR